MNINEERIFPSVVDGKCVNNETKDPESEIIITVMIKRINNSLRKNGEIFFCADSKVFELAKTFSAC